MTSRYRAVLKSVEYHTQVAGVDVEERAELGNLHRPPIGEFKDDPSFSQREGTAQKAAAQQSKRLRVEAAERSNGVYRLLRQLTNRLGPSGHFLASVND